jgi:hypothetical protein
LHDHYGVLKVVHYYLVSLPLRLPERPGSGSAIWNNGGDCACLRDKQPSILPLLHTHPVQLGELSSHYGASFGDTPIANLVLKAMRLPGTKATVEAQMISSLEPVEK